jgi:hypothetical protein
MEPERLVAWRDLCVLTAMNRATFGGVVERLVRSRLVVVRIDA